jgi:hypothetical protein
VHPQGNYPREYTRATSERLKLFLTNFDGFNSNFNLCRNHVNKKGASSVDLSMKLDMLVVLAVFAFVGAILFGAF